MGMAKTLYDEYMDEGWSISPDTMEQIREHEGFRGMPYEDSLGKPTIGVGTLLPLSEDESMLVALCRAHDGMGELWRALGRIGIEQDRLPDPVRGVLTEMAFQLGVPRLMGFKRMLAAIREARWDDAAAEARDSRWHAQTPVRAEHVAKVLEAQVGK